MGDVGSAFLGYSFGVLPLFLLRPVPTPSRPLDAGMVPMLALLLLWPFIGDGLYTFVRRARRREAVWKPHRSHLYQRLVQAGWTHSQVSSLYAGWCLLSALAGWCWLNDVGRLVVPAGQLSSLAALVYFVRGREKPTGPDHD